jgi:hypothetical protein
MMTDVKSAVATATGDMYAGRTRLKGATLTTAGVAGSVVFRDGAGGTVMLTVNTPAVSSLDYVFIPGEGILFSVGVHATITNVSSISIFYG